MQLINTKLFSEFEQLTFLKRVNKCKAAVVCFVCGIQEMISEEVKR